MYQFKGKSITISDATLVGKHDGGFLTNMTQIATMTKYTLHLF